MTGPQPAGMGPNGDGAPSIRFWDEPSAAMRWIRETYAPREACVAVGFLGSGASRLFPNLGLDGGRLLIGLADGCRHLPKYVLAELQILEAQGVELKRLPGLHAKVYLFDRAVVAVGSANLSQNGFRDQHDVLVVGAEEEFVREASAWWDRMWDSAAVLSTSELIPDEGASPASSSSDGARSWVGVRDARGVESILEGPMEGAGGQGRLGPAPSLSSSRAFGNEGAPNDYDDQLATASQDIRDAIELLNGLFADRGWKRTFGPKTWLYESPGSKFRLYHPGNSPTKTWYLEFGYPQVSQIQRDLLRRLGSKSSNGHYPQVKVARLRASWSEFVTDMLEASGDSGKILQKGGQP